METKYKKGQSVIFEVVGGKDDWDMSEKEYEKLLTYHGKTAKIVSDLITGDSYYNIEFSDGYSIEAADLYDLEIIQ